MLRLSSITFLLLSLVGAGVNAGQPSTCCSQKECGGEFENKKSSWKVEGNKGACLQLDGDFSSKTSGSSVKVLDKSKIQLEKGSKLDLKDQVKFQAEGAASVQLKSGSQLEVGKGSAVFLGNSPASAEYSDGALRMSAGENVGHKMYLDENSTIHIGSHVTYQADSDATLRVVKGGKVSIADDCTFKLEKKAHCYVKYLTVSKCSGKVVSLSKNSRADEKFNVYACKDSESKLLYNQARP